jgi:integrase
MGLGSINDVTLSEARERARQYRNLVKDGIDPIEHRNARVAENLAATARVMTFDAASEAYIRQHRAGWKNPVHAAQWVSTLRTYVSPELGRLSVAEIDTAHVRKVLDPIWHDKPETASRVRSRIEAVLAWSIVSGYRAGDNPARWRGHLDKMYPAKAKLRPVRHQKALPYAEMPGFMTELRQRSGVAALALEFAVLTCVRTADVRNAKRADIDLQSKTWIIPALSKTAKEHLSRCLLLQSPLLRRHVLSPMTSVGRCGRANLPSRTTSQARGYPRTPCWRCWTAWAGAAR